MKTIISLNTFITFKSNRGARNMDTTNGFHTLPNDTLEAITLERKLTYMDLIPEIQFVISPGFALGI